MPTILDPMYRPWRGLGCLGAAEPMQGYGTTEIGHHGRSSQPYRGDRFAMTTPDSSRRLRAMVDAVATSRHEMAFCVLDLYRIHAHSGERCARSRARARELAVAFDEIVAGFDPM
jgi:hypothetical protein